MYVLFLSCMLFSIVGKIVSILKTGNYLFKRIFVFETLKSEDVEDPDGRAFSVDHPAEGEQFVDAADDVVEQPRVEAHGQRVDRLPTLRNAVRLRNDVAARRHFAGRQTFDQFVGLNSEKSCHNLIVI